MGTICGAHTQLLSAAELSIGQRIAGIARRESPEALWTERSLVKTFGPRGTVHLLAAQGLPEWIGALSAVPPSARGHKQDVRLSPEQTDAVVAAIDAALSDAALSIDELDEAVVAGAGSWAVEHIMPAFNGLWPRWCQAVATAHRGALCFGPNRAARSYTSPRRWLPAFQPAKSEIALAGGVRRYLFAYGPATPAHFAQWLGTPQRWATEVFDSLAGELQQVEVEGTRTWVAVGDTASPPKARRGVRLLPCFDAYVVGCQPRALLYPSRAAIPALTPSGQARNYPVVLIDGIVAGVWHLRRTGRTLK